MPTNPNGHHPHGGHDSASATPAPRAIAIARRLLNQVGGAQSPWREHAEVGTGGAFPFPPGHLGHAASADQGAEQLVIARRMERRRRVAGPDDPLLVAAGDP